LTEFHLKDASRFSAGSESQCAIKQGTCKETLIVTLTNIALDCELTNQSAHDEWDQPLLWKHFHPINLLLTLLGHCILCKALTIAYKRVLVYIVQQD